jgi:hypothetical protein
MQVVILERNKLVGRKVARLFASVGATVTTIEDPSQAAPLLEEADVICSDTFDADFVAEQVRAHTRLHGVLWTAEPFKRSLRHLVETTRPKIEPGGLAPTGGINHVLGRRDFESPPRAWEVLMVARRFASPSSVAPLSAYLDWGFSSLELDVRSTADRDESVMKIGEYISALAVPRRIVDMFGELAHELLMNAIYDAPIDAQGHPKYAGDRKANVELGEAERPELQLACDGSRLVLQIRDPFGRLERSHVVDGLARGLAGGEQDRTHGGAGLGFMVCHNSTSALFFDVARGRHTEVTALFELDMNLRELRTQAKSLHFWSST